MAELISIRYAESLFEAGLELDKIDSFRKELESVQDLLKKEVEIFEILKHPRITRKEKKSLIDEIFTGRLSQELINFFYVVIDRRREKYLHQIIEQFNQLYNQHMNIANVTAVTAIPMAEKPKERLASVLEERLGKKIVLSNEVDESIIGGVLLKIDNKFIDSTLASQLRVMETAIKGVSL